MLLDITSDTYKIGKSVYLLSSLAWKPYIKANIHKITASMYTELSQFKHTGPDYKKPCP
jgi:hypothetical protein